MKIYILAIGVMLTASCSSIGTISEQGADDLLTIAASAAIVAGDDIGSEAVCERAQIALVASQSVSGLLSSETVPVTNLASHMSVLLSDAGVGPVSSLAIMSIVGRVIENAQQRIDDRGGGMRDVAIRLSDLASTAETVANIYLEDCG